MFIFIDLCLRCLTYFWVHKSKDSKVHVSNVHFKEWSIFKPIKPYLYYCSRKLKLLINLIVCMHVHLTFYSLNVSFFVLYFNFQFWVLNALQLITILALYYFNLSVTDESYVDETRVWRIKL